MLLTHGHHLCECTVAAPGYENSQTSRPNSPRERRVIRQVGHGIDDALNIEWQRDNRATLAEEIILVVDTVPNDEHIERFVLNYLGRGYDHYRKPLGIGDRATSVAFT